jgi:hypothetical protein
VAGFCDLPNEPSASINSRKFLDQLRNYQLLREDSVPGSSTPLHRIPTALF